MSQRRPNNASISTFQLLGGVLFFVIILIAFVQVFAPEKGIAPPPSEIAYEPPPKSQPKLREPTPPPVVPRTPAREEPNPDPVVEEVLDVTEDYEFTITGTVRDSRAGTPLPDALVVAYRQWTSEEESAWNAENVAAVESGDHTRIGELLKQKRALNIRRNGKASADGTFSIKLEEAGEYELTGHLTDYIPIEGHAVLLHEDEPEIVAVVKMSRGATIAGRVTELGSGKGIAGATVTTKFTEAVTDDLGNYLLSGLQPGEYEVTLNLSDVPYKPGPVLPFQKVTLNNPDAELRNVDFALEPAGHVWGYVMTPDRKPIEGASVVLTNRQSVASQAINALIRETPPLSDRSAETGFYELIGVPLNQELQVYSTSDKQAPQLADPFVLTARHRTAHIDIFMFPGTTIYGQVIDESRNPIPKAQVLLLPSYQKLFSPLDTPQAFREGGSAEDGTFVLKDIPAGNYQLLAMQEGYKYSAIGEPVYPNGYHDIKGVQLVLRAVGDGEHAVFGIVQNSDGSPVSGAEIALQGISTQAFGPVSDETTSDSSGKFLFEGLDAGSYQLSVAASGYAAETFVRALLDEETIVTLSIASRVSGRVLARETNQPPTQYGVSATPLQGQSDSFLELNSFTEGVPSETFNAPDGSFTLELRAGFYQLEARATNYTPGRTEISLEPGQSLTGITLYVSESGGRIEGRVQTSNGGNPQGAVVSLAEPNLSSEFFSSITGLGSDNQTQVGQDGVFLFENLPAGEYLITADHEQYSPATQGPIALQENGNASGIVLTLSTGGAVEGYVYQNGQSIPGAIVTIDVLGRPYFATSDENGFYRLENLPPGDRQIRLTIAGLGGQLSGDTQSFPILITDGQTTQYNFGEVPGTDIIGRFAQGDSGGIGGIPNSGVILDAPDAGVPLYGELIVGMDIAQLFTRYAYFTSATDAGEFILNDIPPGEWQLAFFVFEGGSFRVVHSELVTISGDEEELVLNDIPAN